MRNLNIAILGTRGVPNQYGGFEQVASFLSVCFVNKGHAVTVYNSHRHPYKKNRWNGVDIVHCFDPEHIAGTAGQFIYDLNCIMHARKKKYDIILMLGYTSSSVWGWLYPRNSVIITNMDGWEWKRSKYSLPVRKFLLYAEKLAVKYSNHLVADSPVIQSYFSKKYEMQSVFISYGAEPIDTEDSAILQRHGLESRGYYMLMARMEPENNIEMILDGIHTSHVQKPIVVIGSINTSYGKKLSGKFAGNDKIKFIGGLFNQVAVHTLRKHSRIYFHGHSVGGTNPSLLEAMASGTFICAHDNLFNRAVLGDDAFYFGAASDIASLVDNNPVTGDMVANNIKKIQDTYNWGIVASQYEQLFLSAKQ